jgi:hypothetical protein
MLPFVPCSLCAWMMGNILSVVHLDVVANSLLQVFLFRMCVSVGRAGCICSFFFADVFTDLGFVVFASAIFLSSFT